LAVKNKNIENFTTSSKSVLFSHYKKTTIKHDWHFNTPRQYESTPCTGFASFQKEEGKLRLRIAKSVAKRSQLNFTVVVNLDTDSVLGKILCTL
jgi:hypothetical protein